MFKKVNLQSLILLSLAFSLILTTVQAQTDEDSKHGDMLLITLAHLQKQSNSESTISKAEELYTQNIEQQMVQTKCTVCHIEGGQAQTARLKFQKGDGLAAANFLALKEYLSIYGVDADLVLSKIRGINHQGGTQMSTSSDLYAHISEVLYLMDE